MVTSTKIKYENNGLGGLTSGPFLAGNLVVSLYISLITLTYQITFDKKILKVGQGNSLDDVKKKAKMALVELGVVFHDNLRIRGKVEKL